MSAFSSPEPRAAESRRREAVKVRVFPTAMRCEWRLLRLDVGWWTVIVILAACTAYAFANGRNRLNDHARSVLEAKQDETRRIAALTDLLGQIERNEVEPPNAPYLDPRNPVFMGRYRTATVAHLPDAPLGITATGLSDIYPQVFNVSAGSKDGFLFVDEIANPTHLLSGSFDLSFVVVYLYPLLLLALTYNVLSAEQEQGTIALTAASSAPLTTVLAGKLAVRAGGAMVAMIAACWGLLAITGARLDGVGGLVTAGLLTVAIVVYGLFWVALALLVNSYRRDSAFNAVALVIAWVLLLLAAPAALTATAHILDPAPPRSEMVLAVRDAAVDVERDRDATEARYRAEHGGELGRPPEIDEGGGDPIVDERSRLALAVTLAADARADAVLADQEERVRSQRRLGDRLSYLVPPALVNDAIVELAGNGHARWDDYLERIDEFHQRWQSFFVERARLGEALTTADYAVLPRFDPADGRMDWLYASLPRVLASLAWVGALTAVMLLWADRRLSRTV